jgi:A/G-specific adenine glycosylase
MQAKVFQHAVLNWFSVHGRKDLPWQQHPTPYRVWISEIMLQQTQVAAVIPYFQKFVAEFPDIETLASAPLDKVLHYWAGLGYYARARNLHKAAQIITARGGFPDDLATLRALPGVGRSTAGAILSIAYKIGAPILDGNVKRVLCRFYGIDGWPGDSKINKELWLLSARNTPQSFTAEYTQAMMDLGAKLCTRVLPRCSSCPLSESCIAWKDGKIDKIPAAKPSKMLPVKRSTFLLAVTRNRELLLERRPPSGIWGGLWSLPQFNDSDAALTWCASRAGVASTIKLLPERRHSFSHYHLDYAPILALIENRKNNVMETNHSLWYKTQEINALGLPTPIKRLLEEFGDFEEFL